MRERVSVALVGLGGYGRFYLDKLLDDCPPSLHWVAAIDPAHRALDRSNEVAAKGVPFFTSIEEFYRTSAAELTVLVTPVGLHAEQVCCALAHGSHVLCEKPAAATIEDAMRMRDARDKAEKIVAIGYQWSYSDAVQNLKADIAEGRLGAPRRLKSMVLWPRTDRYYGRNSWAGRLRDDAGRPVFDSPVTNAAAHFLHNAFYVLGPRIDASVTPQSVESELYRSYPIETFDSAAVRCRMEGGAEVLLFVSHAVENEVSPMFEFEFEKAVVRYDSNAASEIVARFRNGAVRNYGNPDAQPHRHLTQTVEAIVERGRTPCGIDASIPHVVCVRGVQESLPGVVAFPREQIRRVKSDSGEQLIAEGLAEAFHKAYDAGMLPSEMGVAWARKGPVVDVTAWSNLTLR